MPAAAGTFRRLAAATYDGLLLLAVLMVVTALAQIATGGAAITRASAGPFEYLYRALLALVVCAYFGHAWTRRGQTLGMKAWGIRLERRDGGLPTLMLALRRLAVAAPLYLLAIAGVGLLIARRGNGWIVAACLAPLALSFLWHALRGGGTLHDLASATRVVRVPPGG